MDSEKIFLNWLGSSSLLGMNDKNKQIVLDVLHYWREKDDFKHKNLMYWGIGSLVLKAATINQLVPQELFIAELGRLSYNGNLGWSQKDAITIFQKALKNGSFKNINPALIKRFEQELKKNRRNFPLKKRRVWFPIVDEQKKMVMLDACYWSHRKNRVCSVFEDYSTGDSNKLALTMHEYLHNTGFTPLLEFVATGALDEKSGKIKKIGNAVLKLKTALDAGKTYIFAPKANKAECENCAELTDHQDFKNMIFWVETWDEVKFVIDEMKRILVEQASKESNPGAEIILEKGIKARIKDINTDLDILSKSINEVGNHNKSSLLKELKVLHDKLDKILSCFALT
ncbi:MAG: hypothetical protein II567_06265 [Candidatus Riflebacteria bacterium]|nr:hypothetical protein [Candidatus Riflebacteria bacterium]